MEVEFDRGSISLSGRFCSESFRAFRDACDGVLGKEGCRAITINLSKVHHLDSSALGMLLLLQARAKKHGQIVILEKPSGIVGEVLEMVNFNKIFAIESGDSWGEIRS